MPANDEKRDYKSTMKKSLSKGLKHISSSLSKMIKSRSTKNKKEAAEPLNEKATTKESLESLYAAGKAPSCWGKVLDATKKRVNDLKSDGVQEPLKELSPEQPALISALKKDIIKMTILKYYPGHKIKTGLQFPDVKLLQLKKVEEVLSANHPNPHLEWLKGMLILKGESGALTADPQYYNDDLVRNMIISAVVNAYGDNDSPEQKQKKFNDLKAYMDNLKQSDIQS